MYHPIELLRFGDYYFNPVVGQHYKIAGLNDAFVFSYWEHSGDRCAACALRGADGGKGDFCKMFKCNLPEVNARLLNANGSTMPPSETLSPADEFDSFIGEAESAAYINRLFDECATLYAVEQVESDLRLKLYCEKGDSVDKEIEQRAAKAKSNVQFNAGSGRLPLVKLLLDDFIVKFQPEQSCVYRFIGLTFGGKEGPGRSYRFERFDGRGRRCDRCALNGSNVCEKIFCGGNAETNRGLYGILAVEVHTDDVKNGFVAVKADVQADAFAPELMQIEPAPKKKMPKPRKKSDDEKKEPSELTGDEGEKKLDVAKTFGFQTEYSTSASADESTDKRDKWEEKLRQLEHEASQEDFRAEILRADMKEYQNRAKKLRKKILELIKAGSDEFQDDEPLFDNLPELPTEEDDE